MDEAEPYSVALENWRQRDQSLLEHLDRVTKSPKEEQEKLLARILGKNAGSEYLRKFGLDGATDVKSFRDHVPVANYDSYEPYVNRIFQGDTSPVLCCDPVVEMIYSSATTRGRNKSYPLTDEERVHRRSLAEFFPAVLSRSRRAMPDWDKGKTLFLYCTLPSDTTPGGLPYHSGFTSLSKSSILKRSPSKPFRPYFGSTSPPVLLSVAQMDHAFYIHLLLGLMQREEVVRIYSFFAYGIQTGMRCLEDSWQDMCDDIENGTLNIRVKDAHVREVVLPMLRKDAKLAQLVRQEFSGGKAEDGLIRRLWPNAKVIDSIWTGSMMPYVPAIAKYSDNLPIISSGPYIASEGTFGINMDPLASPEKTRYTLLPHAAYFEFIEVVDGNPKVNPELADIRSLLELQEGHEYEILVTTLAGLYRYRVGDVLKMQGHYNSTPSFEYVGRADAVLNVESEFTHENELNDAVSHAMKVIDRKLGRRVFDFTSVPDHSTLPGHYVIFWELYPPSSLATEKSLSKAVLEECCAVIEAKLSPMYKRLRNEELIKPLELRLVKEGTFTRLMKHAISNGTSGTQYKTPRGINPQNTARLEILNGDVYEKVFAVKKP